MFLTPNGVYDIPRDKHGGKICISIGEFHPNDHHRDEKSGSYGWRKCFGMMGFANQVWGSFITFDSNTSGINIINPPPSDSEKKILAKNSIEYNKKHLADIYNKMKELENSLLELPQQQQDLPQQQQDLPQQQQDLPQQITNLPQQDIIEYLKIYNPILYYIVKGV